VRSTCRLLEEVGSPFTASQHPDAASLSSQGLTRVLRVAPVSSEFGPPSFPASSAALEMPEAHVPSVIVRPPTSTAPGGLSRSLSASASSKGLIPNGVSGHVSPQAGSRHSCWPHCSYVVTETYHTNPIILSPARWENPQSHLCDLCDPNLTPNQPRGFPMRDGKKCSNTIMCAVSLQPYAKPCCSCATLLVWVSSTVNVAHNKPVWHHTVCTTHILKGVKEGRMWWHCSNS